MRKLLQVFRLWNTSVIMIYLPSYSEHDVWRIEMSDKKYLVLFLFSYWDYYGPIIHDQSFGNSCLETVRKYTKEFINNKTLKILCFVKRFYINSFENVTKKYFFFYHDERFFFIQKASHEILAGFSSAKSPDGK